MGFEGLSGVLFGWIDPGGSGQLRWLRCIALEAVWVSDERGIERDGTARGERAGATVMFAGAHGERPQRRSSQGRTGAARNQDQKKTRFIPFGSISYKRFT